MERKGYLENEFKNLIKPNDDIDLLDTIIDAYTKVIECENDSELDKEIPDSVEMMAKKLVEWSCSKKGLLRSIKVLEQAKKSYSSEKKTHKEICHQSNLIFSQMLRCLLPLCLDDEKIIRDVLVEKINIKYEVNKFFHLDVSVEDLGLALCEIITSYQMKRSAEIYLKPESFIIKNRKSKRRFYIPASLELPERCTVENTFSLLVDVLWEQLNPNIRVDTEEQKIKQINSELNDHLWGDYEYYHCLFIVLDEKREKKSCLRK